MNERELRAADGRRLQVYEDGDPAGFPIFVLNGTPTAGPPYRRHVEDAVGRGIRLVAYDRPGYDRSDPRPGRSVAHAADDVRQIADTLGLDRFAAWGISGGGPHLLACAALLPDRLVAAASLASVAPYPADGLDWLAGMGEGNVAEFGAALEGAESLRPFLEEQRAEMLAADPEGLAQVLRSLLGPADLAVWRDEYAVYLHGVLTGAVARGVEGWLEDDLAFTMPWGFEVEDIRVPVLLLHGADDRFVPISHGEWLAARIPGVEARLTEEDGHLTLFELRVPEVHAWLAERF